jgi:hypothetical protein
MLEFRPEEETPLPPGKSLIFFDHGLTRIFTDVGRSKNMITNTITAPAPAHVPTLIPIPISVFHPWLRNEFVAGEQDCWRACAAFCAAGG